MNLALRDPRSGTEPGKDVPDHDQDARDDEARVSANTDHRADVSAKELLNENFADEAARAVFYLRIEQFLVEIYFKTTRMAHVNTEDRQKTSLKIWKNMCSIWDA